MPDGMGDRMSAWAKDQVDLPNLLFEIGWEDPASGSRALSILSLMNSPSHPDVAAQAAFFKPLNRVIDSRSANGKHAFKGFARARTAT